MAQIHAIDRLTGQAVNMTKQQLLGRPGEYVVVTPVAAAAANRIFFDLFNTNATSLVVVHNVKVETVGSVAVVGDLAVDLTVRRTSAIGTAGAAQTPVKVDTNLANLPAGITCRSVPTGGATAAGNVGFASLFAEETNAGTYLSGLLDLVPAPIILRQNQGLAVVQGAVASVGNFVFVINFSVEAV